MLANTSIEKDPIISVVVPAHNVELYLTEAVESLLAQTFKDIEVIVVNDGSSDGTERVARQLEKKDARVRVHSRVTSSGKPAIARNDGIRLAKGRYIALLDADDIAERTRFEKQIRVLKQTEAGVVFSDFQRFTDRPYRKFAENTLLDECQVFTKALEHLQVSEDNAYLCLPSFIEYMLAYMIPVNTQTVMFDRKKFHQKELCFDETFTGGEDWDLFLRLWSCTSFVLIDEVHGFARKRISSITASQTRKCAQDGVRAVGVNFERLKVSLNQKQIEVVRTGLSKHFWDVGYAEWDAGEYAMSRSMFIQSFKVKPSLRSIVGYAKTLLPYAFVKAIKKIIDYIRRPEFAI